MAMLVVLIIVLSLAMAPEGRIPTPPSVDDLQHLSNRISQLNATFNTQLDELEKQNTILKQQTGSKTQKPLVGFSALLSHKVTVSNHQRVIYDKILLNTGGGYSNQTGLFTAPATGTYVFTYSIMGVPRERLHLDMMKNGQTLIRAFSGKGDYTMGTQVIVTNLLVHDKVWVQQAVETSHLNVNDAYYNTFSGFLLNQM